MNTTIHIERKNLSTIPIDYSWSFSDKTIKDTSYLTHGYYTYPAKYIPQLVSRLILEYTKEEDIIIDPFMGSGTTIIEAILHHRIGIGSDINEIAYLCSKVKSTPIDSETLLKEYTSIEFDLSGHYEAYVEKSKKILIQHKRIDYWFTSKQKEELSVIFLRISEIENQDVRDFYVLAFAQILKSSSIWLQKSVKPTRDKNKKIYNPFTLFLAQSKKMIKRHQEFCIVLNKSIQSNIDVYRKLTCGDSRELQCMDATASLVVTSPPYVTSYEYADLHQLPLLWLGYLSELFSYRKKFIGSAYKERIQIDLQSYVADDIISQFENNKKAKEVKYYYADMLESFYEMKRVLKPGGKICLVIGNTEFKGVKILNAEVFQEQLENIGFKTHHIVHREIPSKMLPSTRNSNTGQFVKNNDKNLKLAYPTEYILIMEKL